MKKRKGKVKEENNTSTSMEQTAPYAYRDTDGFKYFNTHTQTDVKEKLVV